jgi:hypothetical protein
LQNVKIATTGKKVADELGMGLGIPSMLLGLVGLAVPVIIHLWNRRRYEIVHWGAMQFLRISTTTRRRLVMEDILLLLLRMALIALFVVALAAPYADNPALDRLGMNFNRVIILLFDGSYSMGYQGTGTTADERARQWASVYLNQRRAGDSVAVLQAGPQAVPVLGEPSQDLNRVRRAIADLPVPRGACDWPQTVQEAIKILIAGKQPQAEIIILTDGQRFGWADEISLLRWELLGKLREQQTIQPRIRVINLDPHRPANPPNWSLAPLRASRVIASTGQQVTFRTALHLHGQQEYSKPYRIHLEIDGRPARDLEAPAPGRLENGQVPLSFPHRFPSPGSHLVSLVVEPDPPPEQRRSGYVVKDQLPGDNRQDLAVEVVPRLPVLLVDGDSHPGIRKRDSDFLRDALSPARDPSPVVLAHVISIADFEPSWLSSNLGKEADTKPRVLVLCNVPRLLTKQQEAVAQFLASGGGVLVTLGERVDGRFYNEQFFREGEGWLPAKLEASAGEEAKLEGAASPLPASFFHPALELFHETTGSLGEARFPRWWKVTVPRRDTAAAPIALMNNGDPLLVERAYQKGRCILCSVPLDNSWGTNLTKLPAFAPLAHELVYYLAGARSAIAGSQDLVQPDPRESDLTPCTDGDRERVSRLMPMTYENAAEAGPETLADDRPKQELWWLFFMGVIALLVGEIWLTRRLAKTRGTVYS